MAHPIYMPGAGRPPGASRPALKERIAALRYVPRLISLVWETQPVYATTMLVLRIVQSVVPLATLWIAKLVIDEVLHLARSGGSSHHLWMLVATELSVAFGGDLLARASGLIETLLGDLFTNRISI